MSLGKGTGRVLLALVAAILLYWAYKAGVLEDLPLPWKDKETSISESPPPEPVVAEDQDPSRPGFSMGSCTTLVGDVHLVAVFLDDDTARWTPEEVQAFLDTRITPGVEFLERQAQLYGTTLNLSVLPMYTNEQRTIAFPGEFNDHIIEGEDGTPTVDYTVQREERTVLAAVAQNLGYDSREEMHSSLQQLLGSEKIGYLVIPAKAGYSYGFWDAESDGNVEFEYAVLFPWDIEGLSSEADSVARWIMTLFAGSYSTESVDGREPTMTVAKRHYANSIKLYQHPDLTDAFVDPYMAYQLGWLNVLPPENARLEMELPTPVPTDPDRMQYNKGTCRDLRGTPLVLTIFVDDDVSGWDQAAIDRYLQNLLYPGLQYLQNQASRRGIPLEFKTGQYATDPEQGTVVRYRCVVPEEHSLEVTRRDLLDQVALSLGFPSKVALYDTAREWSGEEQVILVLALNKPGRAYAYPDHDEDPGDQIEYCVVQTAFASGERQVPASVAHEILHLFGAEDLYAEGDLRAGRDALARQYYNGDVMRNTYYNINQNTLGAYTLYSIGWSQDRPAVCDMEQWWN